MGHRYLFLACFTCTLDITGFTYYGEVFPNHLRAKGVTVGIGGSAVVTLILTQVAETAFKNIGWRFFLVRRPSHPLHPSLMRCQVFIICPAAGLAYIYIRCPETKGRPLCAPIRVMHVTDETKASH